MSVRYGVMNEQKFSKLIFRNSFQAKNECDSNGICRNTVGSYFCDCVDGYQTDGEKGCTDTDECSGGRCLKKSIDLHVKMAKHHTDNLPCGQSGKCVNSWGSYNCECPKGLIFKGILVQVTECLFQ